MINVLRITELFNGKLIILTSGEDECIKMWDTKFNLVNEFNIRNNVTFDKIPPPRTRVLNNMF
jgi:hypothetical protein